MPKIDLSKCAVRTTTIYPAEYAKFTDGRIKTVLGNDAGLTQFGVNLTRLKPGAASALRHSSPTGSSTVQPSRRASPTSTSRSTANAPGLG